MLEQERHAAKPPQTDAVPANGNPGGWHAPTTRRDFLRTSGLAAGALIALSAVDGVLAEGAFASAPAVQAAGTPLPLVVGVIEGVASPNTLRIRSRRAGPVVVRVASDALVRRGIHGAEKRLDAFRLGDAVVAEGAWADGAFVAHAVESAFQVVAGTVQRRSGAELTVADRQLVLRDETMIFTGYGFADTTLAAISVGDEVVVATWYDPGTASTVAARIAKIQRAK